MHTQELSKSRSEKGQGKTDETSLLSISSHHEMNYGLEIEDSEYAAHPRVHAAQSQRSPSSDPASLAGMLPSVTPATTTKCLW